MPVMTRPRKRDSKLPLPSLRPSQRAGEHGKQREADNGEQRPRSQKASAEAGKQQSGHSLRSPVTIRTGVSVFLRWEEQESGTENVFPFSPSTRSS